MLIMLHMIDILKNGPGKKGCIHSFVTVNKKGHSNVTNAPKGIGLAYDTFEESYLQYRRYAPDNEVRSQCQGKSDPKWYTLLHHPKMNTQTKFGIPTSNNIGDMLQTRLL